MEQNDVMLEDGRKDTEEQVVDKLSRFGHLGQVFPWCHITDKVLQFILPKKVPHILQNHLPGKFKLKGH